MCTLIINWQPENKWPITIGTNRDEMLNRPWKAPARHWQNRPDVIGGLDQLAGGSWLGLNDFGVVAGILNRQDSLGPKPNKRSRGELVLEALDHSDAIDAATALADLNSSSYRAFNMIIADNRDALWIRHTGQEDYRIEVFPLPYGLSMITSQDLNDPLAPRIAHHLHKMRKARNPDPNSNFWSIWPEVLTNQTKFDPQDPTSAMNIRTDYGFGTISSSLIALPSNSVQTPVWLFAAGPPDKHKYNQIQLY